MTDEVSTTAYSGNWQIDYRLPWDGPVGPHLIEATCLPSDPAATDVHYEPITLMVEERPRDLEAAISSDTAAPGEEVTVTPVDPCPNGGEHGDVLAWWLYSLGPDGTDEPTPVTTYRRRAIHADGTWSVYIEAPPEEAVYRVTLACITTYYDIEIPHFWHADYTPLFFTVSDDEGPRPTVPTDPPPVDPSPPELPPGSELPPSGASGPSGEPGHSGAPSATTEPSSSLTPAATAVPAQPDFTG